jgi:hypothetical protein
MESLLGRKGEPPACKMIGKASMHWFPSGEDRCVCVCGERERLADGETQPALKGPGHDG